MPTSSLSSRGDGYIGAAAALVQPASASATESASGVPEADLQRRLEEARLLLRRAAHLCRYHQPGLQREIDAFLALVRDEEEG